MLNYWWEVTGYAEFVKKECKLLNVNGWSSLVLKEKLKRIKQILKEWNKTHCGDLDNQIAEAKSELEVWDLKGEESLLSEEDSAARRECMATLRRLYEVLCVMSKG